MDKKKNNKKIIILNPGQKNPAGLLSACCIMNLYRPYPHNKD